MWNLKYVTSEPIYETETKIGEIENRLMVAKGRGVEEGRKSGSESHSDRSPRTIQSTEFSRPEYWSG